MSTNLTGASASASGSWQRFEWSLELGGTNHLVFWSANQNFDVVAGALAPPVGDYQIITVTYPPLALADFLNGADLPVGSGTCENWSFTTTAAGSGLITNSTFVGTWAITNEPLAYAAEQVAFGSTNTLGETNATGHWTTSEGVAWLGWTEFHLFTGGITNVPNVAQEPGPAPAAGQTYPTNRLIELTVATWDGWTYEHIPPAEIQVLGRTLDDDRAVLANLPVFLSNVVVTPHFPPHRTYAAGLDVFAQVGQPRVYFQSAPNCVHQGFDPNGHPSRWFSRDAWASIRTNAMKETIQVWVDPPEAGANLVLLTTDLDNLTVEHGTIGGRTNPAAITLTAGGTPGDYQV